MLKLEDIKRGSQIVGLVPKAIATISVAEMVGENAVSAIYKLSDGSIKERMVYREEPDSDDDCINKNLAVLLQKAVRPEETL